MTGKSQTISHLYKSEENLLLWVFCTYIFMVVVQGSFMIWFRRWDAHVSLWDWSMHNDSIFRHICVENMDINSPFFREQSIFETRCQTGVSQKIIVWTCLKRDLTPTFLLDRVIFDVIGDSLVSTSPCLPCIQKIYKYKYYTCIHLYICCC